MANFTDIGTRAAFLQRLTQATREGRLRWLPSDSVSWWFHTAIGDSYICSIISADGDDLAPYDFRLFKKVEGSDDEEAIEIEEWSWDRGGVSGLNKYLEDLYIAAKAFVLGVSNLTEDLFRSISEIDGGPSTPQSIPVRDSPPPMPF